MIRSPSSVAVRRSISFADPVSRPSQPQASVEPVPTVASIACHGTLYDRVSPINVPLWTAACEHLLTMHAEASQSGDRAVQADAFIRLLRLPAESLAKLTRAGKNQHRRERPGNAIDYRLRTLIQHMEEPSTPNTPQTQHTLFTLSAHSPVSDVDEKQCDEPAADTHNVTTANALTADDEDKKAALRAAHLMKEGQVRRAAQALDSTTAMADCTDPSVQAQLRQLHPPFAPNTALPQLPDDAPTIHLEDSGVLTNLLRRSDNGARGGPSGWGGNMIAVLADFPKCRIGLLRLLQDIINGNIPVSVQPHLLACRLVASNKAHPSTGIRPIAVGEVFYRLAAIAAVHRVVNTASTLLQPHQYGVGVPGGCERIVHSLQHRLLDTDVLTAALTVDINNAFNCCDRSRLLDKLHNTPELAAVWRITHLAYATSSPLLLQRCNGQSIDSANGIRQGDPLSSLLFCLYMQDTLIDIAQRCHVTHYAFIDDLHMEGAPADVMQAFERLQILLPALSLSINTAKSQLLYFHNATHPLSADILDTLRTHAHTQHRCGAALCSRPRCDYRSQ